MFLRPIRFAAVAAVVTMAAVHPAAQAPAPATQGNAAANDTVKGAALLLEARKALGGDDKLAAIKRLEIKGEVTQVAANQTLDGEVTLLIETPDKFKRDEEISLPGGSVTITRTQALNGADVWDVTEGGLPGGFGRGGRGGDFGGRGRLGGILGGAVGGDAQAQGQVDPARQAALREQQRRTRQTDLTRLIVGFLATTAEPPAWVGTAVTPKDEKADVLEFPTADGTTTRLFLDITTHMPLMMTYSGPAPRGQGRQGQGGGNRGGGDQAAGGDGGFRGRRGGGDGAAAGAASGGAPQAGAAPQGAQRGGGQPGQTITIEMYLGDYKAENGIKTPRHITREVNGEIQEELRIKSIKLNPNFKANTFTQPK